MNGRAHGFTLLEVMVAVAILGMGLTAVSGAIGMSVRSLSISTGYERALRVADNELSRFLATRPESGRAHLDGVTEGVRWTLSAEPDTDMEGLMRVLVEAEFHAAGGRRSVVLETREASRMASRRINKTSESNG